MDFDQTLFQTLSFGPFEITRPRPWIAWGMDPRKQPGWRRLATEGAPLGSYRKGWKVWVYRGAGWSRGTVEAVQAQGGSCRVVVKLSDERGGHPFVVCYDSRNICRSEND